MPAPRSLRLPPRVGVNSNIGRVVRPPPTPIKIDRNTPQGRAAVRALAAVQTAASNVAPVCPTSRGEIPPGQPGIKVPFIPKVTTPEEAVRAVNQIIDVISADAEPTIRWLEKYRETEIVRIENPQDPNQWVEVERIIVLVMEDQITGDLWYWELGPSNPPAPIATAATPPDPFAIYRGATGTVVRPPGAPF